MEAAIPKRLILQSFDQLPDLTGIKTWVLDTETSGLHPHLGHRICGICLGPYDRGWSIYIPIRHREKVPYTLCGSGESQDASEFWEVLPPTDRDAAQSVPPNRYKNMDPKEVLAWLKPLLDDSENSWILHNAAFDINMLRIEGLEIKGQIFDTMVAAHIAKGHLPSYSLDYLTDHFLNFNHEKYNELKEWFTKHQPKSSTWGGKAMQDYSLVPIELLGEYGCEDIDATRLLAHVLITRNLQEGKQYNQGNPSWDQKKLRRHEMELVRVIADMTYNGIRMDIPRIIALREKTLDEIESWQNHMYRLCGYYFNPGSWKQLWEAFEAADGTVMYWMSKKDERGKQKADHFTEERNKSNGRPCWNAAAILKYLEHYRKRANKRAYQFILAYRESQQRKRLVSTYLEAYLRLTDHEGFLHPGFLQHGTRTGRLSSVSPNVQNLTKVKGNLDQKNYEAETNLHAMIQSGKINHEALSLLDGTPFADSEDESLARQLRSMFIAREGHLLISIDYSSIEYRLAAYYSCDEKLMDLYHENPSLDYHQMTADLARIDRSDAKTVNFGTLYGMGIGSLASLLGVSFEQSKSILNRIFAKRPALKRMITGVQARANKDGFIQNNFGRVCEVPSHKAFAALNYIIQGMAGDIMRAALVRVAALIKKKNWPVLMLITVHDQIMLDIPVELVAEVAPQVAYAMCCVPEVSVPLLCEAEVGLTWGDQINFKEWLKKRSEKEHQLAAPYMSCLGGE